jgi:hypothetical protein
MVILYVRFVVFKFSYLENVLNEEVTIVEYTHTEISLLLYYFMSISSSHLFRTHLYYLKMTILDETFCKTK